MAKAKPKKTVARKTVTASVRKTPTKSTSKKLANAAKTATKTSVKTTAKTAAASSAGAPSRGRAGEPAPSVMSPVAQEPLVLAAKPAAEPVAPRATLRRAAAKPVPATSSQGRADLPPQSGFTLLVDGHFKSSFDSRKLAEAAASELKDRFPMLRVEIYDAARKTRSAV